MKAWDVQEAIRKSFATHGSGGAPLTFEDEEGNKYEFADAKADRSSVTVSIKRA